MSAPAIYEPPVDVLSAAVESAVGMGRRLGEGFLELTIYLARHRELGYLVTAETSCWSAIGYTR
jgi:hypothetical protein